MDANANWIERSAKLFEVGDYPDKGVSFGSPDLERLAANFHSPVPVLIEHATSPLELGSLVSVWVEGNDLLGKIRLSQEANALIETNQAKSLSIGLSADLETIEEVSLVQQPRVTSAKIFSGRLDEAVDWKRQFMALQNDTLAAEADRKVTRWLDEGRILPAQAEIARSLLNVRGATQFNGTQVPLAALLEQFVEQGTKHNLFREHAPEAELALSTPLSPDENEFYQRYFPGLALTEIARQK